MAWCDLCGADGATVECKFCGAIVACNQEELSIHRPGGGIDLCLPFKVSRHPAKGRILVPARDIKEGELVLVDEAIALVPCTEAVCLSCFNPWPSPPPPTTAADGGGSGSDGFRCDECSLPFCNSQCSSNRKWHSAQECQLVKNKLPWKTNEAAANAWTLQVISIVRIIKAMRSAKSRKWQIDQLMDHNNLRSDHCTLLLYTVLSTLPLCFLMTVGVSFCHT